jgi:Tfp pilus assembly protein FimT
MPRHFIPTAERMKKIANNKRQAGFSTFELLVVVAVSVVVTAIAVPSYLNTAAYLRAAGDLRSLNGVTAQAKMRAAANFTHARVYADLSGNAFQLQVWYKAGNAGAGCWVADSDPGNNCLTYTSGHPSGTPFNLSQGVTFGFGTLATGPTPGQPTPTQAAACLDNSNASLGTTTACIVFNSRGIPIDNSNSPISSGALYLTNGTVVNGVTVSATGSIQAWSSPATSVYWSGQ